MERGVGCWRINMLSLCVILTRPRCAISINPPRRWRFMTATTRFPFTNGRRRDGPVVCTDSPEYPFINPSRFCYTHTHTERGRCFIDATISPSPNEFHGLGGWFSSARKVSVTLFSLESFVSLYHRVAMGSSRMNYGLLNRCTIYLFIYFFWIDPFASFIIVAAGEMHFMMELINTMDNNNWRYIFFAKD